ncbi:MAG TPA: glycosyltransferase family 2 protein, partial [Bacteroidia bacterium]|nr:glycosyltransferase family 2 protein [Bacteroidia bacterium]
TYPEVVIIRNRTNAGFSEANNQGMKMARANYLLLLNPDTYLIDSSICKLIDFVKEKGNNVLAGPKLLNNDRSLQYSAWKDKTLSVMFQEAFRIYRSAYKVEQFTSPEIVDVVSGAAMLFPKAVVEKIGYFDNDIFWQDDFDYCYRARNAGITIYYFPEASIVHYVRQSADKNPNIFYANFIISNLRLYKKHHSKFEIFLAFIFTWFHLVGYTVFLLILSPFSKTYRKKVIPYFYTFRKFMTYLFTGRVSLT